MLLAAIAVALGTRLEHRDHVAIVDMWSEAMVDEACREQFQPIEAGGMPETRVFGVDRGVHFSR